jgi:Protein of unknown function (DUF4231)
MDRTLNVANRLAFLRLELDRQQQRFQSMRKRDKRRAFRLQMGTVAFSATITVLLGIRVGARVQPVLANVALALGALVTVLAAYEAFFNHRGLWLNRTVTVHRLFELRGQMSYRLAGLEDSEVQPEVVDELIAQLNQILEDDHHAWMRLRSVDVQPANPARPAAGGGVALPSRSDEHPPEAERAT